MLNLLDVFFSLSIWRECFICYYFEHRHVWKSLQLKCALNIFIFIFGFFGVFMQMLSLCRRVCSDKKGMQWCAIWITKYITKHKNIVRHKRFTNNT